MVVIGFFFTTKNERDETKSRHRNERKMEKKFQKLEEARKKAASQTREERERVFRETEAQIKAEQNRKDSCHEEDQAVIESWEEYFQGLVRYNRENPTYDSDMRGNDPYILPPRHEESSN